ncbi:hypothetical protein [Kribbella sp. NPDC051620]|uniref:hypothetical protein n=1 Tax=Kribbella sp. NPDC051620 TaxID=3364120 RepID=UPI00378E431D
MTSLTAMRAEITRWENDLAELEAECTAEGWTEPEKLLMILQRTSGAYRHKVLPRLETDRLPLLPAMPDSAAPRALAVFNLIIVDELGDLVSRLDDLRLELIRFGQTPQLRLQATEILAGLRALGRLLLRFSQEAENPALSAQLTATESGQPRHLEAVRPW